MRVVASVLGVVLLSCGALFAQQPPLTPPNNPSPPSEEPPAASAPAAKARPVPSFLIIGTVFNENALSFPGVQVRVRRTGDKKFTWETYTNSRGEFAVRVFPGYEYEVVTHIKKYQDQSRAVDAKVDVQQRLSIKLEPVNHAGAGAKL
jgi:hypothetical protein